MRYYKWPCGCVASLDGIEERIYKYKALVACDMHPWYINNGGSCGIREFSHAEPINKTEVAILKLMRCK